MERLREFRAQDRELDEIRAGVHIFPASCAGRAAHSIERALGSKPGTAQPRGKRVAGIEGVDHRWPLRRVPKSGMVDS